MTDFQLIRRSVQIEEVAKWLGIEVHGGKARCPFHNDQTPSLSFKDGRFTQSLDGIKLNHLNYAEELLDRSVNSGATSTSGIREPFQDLVGRLPNLLAGL